MSFQPSFWSPQGSPNGISPFANMLGAGGTALGMGMYKNPANPAMNDLNEIQGAISPYMMPWINAGTGALDDLQGQYQNLMNNPSSFLNKFQSTYQQSPGFQFNLDQGEKAIAQQQAASGMTGTPAAQQAMDKFATGEASQDFGSYMQRIMGMYGQGLQGEQGIMNNGFNASRDYSDTLGNILMSKAKLAYAGTQNQNQSNQGGLGSALGFLGGAAPYLATL